VRTRAGARVERTVARFATTTPGLVALATWLTDQRCPIAVMEATGVYWKPVWHLLEASVSLLLVHAAHLRAVTGRKSDLNDAAWLADLLAHGLLRTSFVPPPPIQALRDLTRTRKQFVRQIAQHTLRPQKTLEDANIKVTGLISDLLGVSGRALVRGVIEGETDPDQLLARTTGPDRLRAALTGG
jgi:transposase